MLYSIGSQTVLRSSSSKGWVSNKRPPVSHLLHGIWPSSLSTCFTGGPLSSREETREMKKQQQKWRNGKQERENISPHPEEDKEEYGGQWDNNASHSYCCCPWWWCRFQTLNTNYNINRPMFNCVPLLKVCVCVCFQNDQLPLINRKVELWCPIALCAWQK